MPLRYRLNILRAAKEFIDDQPEKVQGWFARQIKAVLETPLDSRSTQLRGNSEFRGQPLRRMKVGKNYRFIYSVDDESLELTILDAGWRKDIYKKY